MIDIICGSMFSGKTEELIRRLRRHVIAGESVVLLKPKVDTRTTNVARSHNGTEFDAIEITTSKDILLQSEGKQVIGIDEAQFLAEEVVDVVVKLSREGGKRFIISGLDMDFRGRPFGIMPTLLAVADSVTKLHAVCEDCKRDATVSYRMSDEKSQIVIGSKDKYVALCWDCANKRDIALLRRWCV